MEIPISAKVFGEDRIIKIENDPSWGKMKILFKSAVSTDAKGNQKIDTDAFFDKLLELVIIDGFPEIKEKTKMLQVPTSEMTFILGEILKAIPLQQYMTNLGLTENGNLLTML